MAWYYANQGQQHGPVSAEELSRLVARGVVTGDTLVWREGMAAWSRWADVAPTVALPEAVPTLSPPPAPGTGTTASAAASAAPAGDAATFWQNLRANGYRTSVKSILRRAWRLYTGALWPNLGVTLLGHLIMMSVGWVPILGLLAAFLVAPQIMAGIYWYFLRQIRREPAQVNDLFAGFARQYGQLALVGLLQFLISLPLVALMAGMVLLLGLFESAEGVGAAGLRIGLVATIPVLVVVMTVVMYRFVLAHLIVLDRGEQAWPALVLSWRIVGLRLWTLVGLGLVLALLSLLGVVALVIGVLFVLPLLFAAVAYAYEDAVRSARNEPAPE